jgi:hypothetical protein
MDLNFFAFVFAFVIVLTLIQNRAKERRERLRVIEDAIRGGHLDPAMRQELVGELTGRSPERRRAEQGTRPGLGRILFGLGWLMMCLGIGLMFVNDRDAETASAPVAAVGFALVSLPFALRELERGRSAGRS